MSRFLKNVLYKQKQVKGDEITNYLISEIEDIVAKKVGNSSLHNLSKEEENYNNKTPITKKKASYGEGINYTIKKEQPFKATTYITDNSSEEYLPFEEKELRPKIHNEEQIKSLVKRTLRPALNQWLDENLDIIIDKAIRKSSTKYRYNPNSKRNFHYYDK